MRARRAASERRQINKIIGRLAEKNDLKCVIDQAHFNDESKLGTGKEMQDRLSKLVAIFDGLDLRANSAEGDDLLGDAYEYLMRHFATESGKSKGPAMLKSENGRLSGWVYIDLRGRALSAAVRDMQQAVARGVPLPPGYSISWSGQFEYLERATERLKIVVPTTLIIIFVLLLLTFRRFNDAGLIMATLPLALAGGFWFMYFLGYNMSIASAVGFIALGGVAAEIGKGRERRLCGGSPRP